MWNIATFLTVIWAITLLYGEMFAYWMPLLRTCSWPHLPQYSSSSSMMNGTDYASNFAKVAVIADPQLTDRTSLNLAPKSLALEMMQFYSDLYMRRAFHISVLQFDPDVVLFLGDYFHGGATLSDEEWQESLSRFKHIFDLNTRRRDKDIPIYYVPGNRDVSYSSVDSRTPKVIERYEKDFGTTNSKFTVGNVEFISVDAQARQGNSQNELTSASLDFIKKVSSDPTTNKRVLLSHVPLHRQDGTPCGPHRSSPIFIRSLARISNDQNVMKEHYQNSLTKESSNNLLNLIAPVLVLSGHDHDQCTVTHMSKYGPIIEHTLGTFSWQQGSLHPSFMLLSASKVKFDNSSGPVEAVATDLCFLPMQSHIYLWYLSLSIITLLALHLWPTSGISVWPHLICIIGSCRMLISQNTKEKNEDENCEYEMIWDAEGSMHLVKKAQKVPLKGPDQRTSIERGNAVMRAAARKPTTDEMEASAASEVNIDMGSDGLKLPSRTSKSMSKRVIQRLFRTSRILIVIVIVNVPLYMMLLFKDWIN